MEERKAKLIANKSGGTASKGGYTWRATIPTAWINELNITKEDREVTLYFDKDKREIIIKA